MTDEEFQKEWQAASDSLRSTYEVAGRPVTEPTEMAVNHELGSRAATLRDGADTLNRQDYGNPEDNAYAGAMAAEDREKAEGLEQHIPEEFRRFSARHILEDALADGADSSTAVDVWVLRLPNGQYSHPLLRAVSDQYFGEE